MNDKIKELLENAEKSDAIAKNKWRIENREQLRKERKQKLKELMEQDKQKDIVELAFKLYPFSSDSVRNAFITGYNKAKEMECVLLCAKEQKSIELPSDEEIEKESNNEYQEQKQSYENSVEMFPIDFANYLEVGFIEGAKWMRNKIQGNKE
jgi:hypothetical protein